MVASPAEVEAELLRLLADYREQRAEAVPNRRSMSLSHRVTPAKTPMRHPN